MPNFYILKCAKHIITLAKQTTIINVDSNPEMHHNMKSYIIKCKHESCLKIEQYCIENNLSVEASCKHYGIQMMLEDTTEFVT